MTNAEYQASLASCNFSDPLQVSKLITSTHTNVKFNDAVAERQLANPLGAYNYFSQFFGKEVWPDGQGEDLIREFVTDPYIPFTFSHFMRMNTACNPNLANECDPIPACVIPEGGKGTLPSMVRYKHRLQTQRDCIANVRHIRDFEFYGLRVIRNRELADEQIMNMFYVMAGMRTAGNKITMQGLRDANGALRLAPSTDPRNPMRGGIFNYMQEYFAAPTNLNDIVPLTVDALQNMARYWAQFPKGNEVAKGPRGENIYEFWTPDDWYQDEAIRNPDFVEKLKIMMPNSMFAGTSLASGEREVIGNWAAKTMPFLPRFAPTSDGRIVPVDSHIGVDIEVGQEFVGSIDFENAPFGMAMQVSGKQGTILTRPDLNSSLSGFPITPITGNSGWRIRNDYDKECNEQTNKPFSEKNYEMYLRMDDPAAATSILFRRRVHPLQPVNECDVAPIFTVSSNEVDCAVTNIGCNSTRREGDDITQGPGATHVQCTASVCGNGLVAPFQYLLKVERKANMPDYNSLGCQCGDTVNLFVYNEENEYVKQINGVYKSDALGFPYARYFIETTTKLLPGECIKGIACADGTRLIGNVIDAFDQGVGNVGFILDSPIDCAETDSVSVKYYSASNVLLGTVVGEVETVDPDRFFYKISSANPAFNAGEVFVGQVSILVTCTEAPNTED